MKISETVGRLTPSEQKAIDTNINQTRKVVLICRSRGGDLIVYIEKTDVPKSKKHKPPFRYNARYYNKWGKLLFYKAGNIWDGDCIIDDFTRVSSNPRYKRICNI
jgi:hypothetical protein